MKIRKIVLVGCGAVGTSFVYSAINQGLAQEYVLIDIFKDNAEGNALDFSDCQALLSETFISVKTGEYKDCKDADIIVITAGRPQKPNETRIDMVVDNAQIINKIALEIKKSGFKGISIIASNPVDIITTIYQRITGFDVHKVLSSGTLLDSSRLRYLIGIKFNVNPKSVSAYVMGEHGDSSIVPWSCSSIMGKSLNEYIKEGKVTNKELNDISQQTVDRAYKIIKLKKSTYYGIGTALALIVKTIINGQNEVLMVGAYLQGEYGETGFYSGVPTVINEHGWNRIVTLPLNKEEQIKFAKSCQIVKSTVEEVWNKIK